MQLATLVFISVSSLVGEEFLLGNKFFDYMAQKVYCMRAGKDKRCWTSGHKVPFASCMFKRHQQTDGTHRVTSFLYEQAGSTSCTVHTL